MDLKQSPKEWAAEYKQIVGNTVWVLLLAYSALITMASFSTYHFWDGDRGYGTDKFFPFTGARWKFHWSIEEYLFYILLAWIVTYHIKKGQRSEA